jgi:hypothetical protein
MFEKKRCRAIYACVLGKGQTAMTEQLSWQESGDDFENQSRYPNFDVENSRFRDATDVIGVVVRDILP